MTDAADILSGETFNDLSVGQRSLLLEFYGKIKGKGAAAALPVCVSFAAKAAKERPLTETQKAAVIAAFYKSMPDKERANYERLFKKLGVS